VVGEVAGPAEPEDGEGLRVIGVMHLGERGAAGLAGEFGKLAAFHVGVGVGTGVGFLALERGERFVGVSLSVSPMIGGVTFETGALARPRI